MPPDASPLDALRKRLRTMEAWTRDFPSTTNTFGVELARDLLALVERQELELAQKCESYRLTSEECMELAARLRECEAMLAVRTKVLGAPTYSANLGTSALGFDGRQWQRMLGLHSPTSIIRADPQRHRLAPTPAGGEGVAACASLLGSSKLRWRP